MGDLLNHKHLTSSGYVNCPDCGNQFKVFDYLNSNHFGCSKCHTFFTFDKQIRSFNIKDFEAKPEIPIGSIGTFDGNSYTVAGFMIKKEKGNNYKWREYLLINAEKGYAFLSEFDGHWNFIAGTNHYPDLTSVKGNNYAVTYQDTEYKLFNKYEPQLLYAVGEFDWDISNEHINARELIAPPYMLVRENQGKGGDWFLATYKSPSEIAGAFKIKRNVLPTRFGVGANQPSPFEKQAKGMVLATSLTVILMLVITWSFNHNKPEKEVFHENYIPVKDSSGWNGGTYKTITTGSFKVEGLAALNIKLRSDVSNEWMEVPVTLINDKTGKFYEFSKAIEFYHGYADGESWSEGDQEANAVLSNIPSGDYHLSIEPASDGRGDEGLEVVITQNTTLWSNFVIFLLIILIYPVFQAIRKQYFDRQRWSNSDYSPYDSEY